MCIRDRLTPHQKRGVETKLTAFDIYDIVDDRWRAYMPVSYTHLDVYKRQVLYAMIAVYPFPFIDLTPVKAN